MRIALLEDEPEQSQHVQGIICGRGDPRLAKHYNKVHC